MGDVKTFWLEILSFIRKTSRSPESVLSTATLTVIIFSLTILVLIAAPVFMTKELALLFIYGIAIFEILFGLRVGFLRLSTDSNEQFLSVSSRFWKRSFPYTLPAILIPIPISISVTNFLATNQTNWWLILVSIISIYMLFFTFGTAWSVLTRVVAKRAVPRIIILTLTAVALLSILSSGDFIFRTVLISQNYSDYMQLLTILAALSLMGFFVTTTDLLLENIKLTKRKFHRYWPIFLGKWHIGQGQGSSTFAFVNKYFLRSTAFHRRISGVILSLIFFMLIIYAVLFVGGSNINSSIILTTILVFTAVTSLLISRKSAQLSINMVSQTAYLPIYRAKIINGAWMAGLIWQVISAIIFYGIIATWINIQVEIIYLIIIGAVSQHVLFFGWADKLEHANHHNLSLFAVFSLSVLLGILPILLLPVAGLFQTILVQLIWLGFVGILLHTTTQERTTKYA